MSETNGRLPAGWCLASLTDIAEINPVHPTKTPVDHDVVSFVPMGAVQALTGRLDASGRRPWGAVKKAYTKFQDGDVLFAKITPCMENGKVALATGLQGGVGAGSTEFHVLRPGPALNAKFLMFRFLQEQVRRSAREKMTGTAGQLRVPGSFLEDLSIPLAPVAEQQRLVDAVETQFSRLDDALTLLERVRRDLKRYRAAILKAAVEGLLVPTEAELARAEGREYEPADVLLKRILAKRRRRWEEADLARLRASGKEPPDDRWRLRYQDAVTPECGDLRTLPEGWCWASMDQLTYDITSGSRDWSRYYGSGKAVFLMAQNIRPGWLDLSFRQTVDPPADDSARYRSQVQPNDLLVTIVGANTGDVCRVPTALPEHYVCQSVALMRPVLEASACFLEYYLNSPVGQAVYEEFTYGQGRPHLGFEHLKATRVPLPPLAEQLRIADRLSEFLSEHAAIEQTANSAQPRCHRLRQAILASAFEGKLVDQDPTDEPASVLLERVRGETAAVRATTGQKRATQRRRGRRVEVAEAEEPAR